MTTTVKKRTPNKTEKVQASRATKTVSLEKKTRAGLFGLYKGYYMAEGDIFNLGL